MMPQQDANLQIDPDPRLEREAEEAAQQARQDGPVVINRMGTEMHIQRAKKGSESGSDSSSVNRNKIAHIFGQPKHNLGLVVNYFGSEEKAFKAMKETIQSKADTGEIDGRYEETVRLGPCDVTIRGKVIDGTARIGTAWNDT